MVAALVVSLLGVSSVHADPAYTFSGVLADQSSHPIAGVSLSLSNASGGTVSTTTGADGSFSLSVAPGMYSISNVSATNVDGFYLLGLKQTGAPTIDLTAGNVTQNLTLPVTTVNYTAYDATGHVIASGAVDAGSAYNAASLVSLYPGDPGEWVDVNTGPMQPTSQGTGSFSSVVGVIYGANTICDFTSTNQLIGCNSQPFTVTSGANNVIIPTVPAPTNLAVASPTTEPSLTWDAVAGATSYNVYRDGTKLASVTTPSFLDNNVSGGAHTYYVTAADGVGDESVPSTTASVTVNLVTPVLGTPTFSTNPVIKGQSTTVTVTVQGNLYGFLGGEYYIGSTDPGVGHGTVMTYSNGVLTAVISDLNTVGNQTLHIRAQNGAGWGTAATGTVSVVNPIFSGTLTDSNGVALAGVPITIKDAQGDTGSATTTTGGAFSMSVAPGMYYIYNLGGVSNIDGISYFSLNQSSTNPSINLVSSNLTQNLVVPVATVNYTAYNAQGYAVSLYVMAVANSGSVAPVSIYAGDPGEKVYVVAYEAYISGGVGSFKSIVGATYAGTGSANGICDFTTNDTSHMIGCTASYTVVSGTNVVSIPQAPAPRNTFSGNLTDSNGVALVGAVISLRDVYGNQVSTTTGAGGSFSIAVEPGMYYIYSLSANGIDGMPFFNLAQSSANPSINLTAGNVAQNLVLPVATVNYTTYNAQGYVANLYVVAQTDSGSATPVSLYAGDPGESVSVGAISAYSGGTGMGSFKTIVGTTYVGAYVNNIWNGICEYTSSAGNQIGCAASYTVVTGANTVSIPHAPAPRNIFSGTLTDSDGVALSGVTVKLQDVYGNIVSTTTGSGGSFSVAVEPGMYGLIVSSTGTPNVDTLGGFTVQQITASIDLTTGNLTQNLVLPVTTMNITLYNAQGYVNSNGRLDTFGASGMASLYAGDPGEAVSMTYSTLIANSSGVVTFKTVLGVTYNGQSSSTPTSVVLGPDGAIWFDCAQQVETVTATSSLSAYPISSSYTNPGQMTVAGGALWYVESASGAANKYIGKMTSSGTTTDYYVGYPLAYLTTGSDGNIWFTSSSTNLCLIGRLNVSTGAINCYATDPWGDGARPITTGSDGNIYYLNRSISDNKYRLFRLNPTTYAGTTAYTFDTFANLISITSGPDGRLYLTDQYYGKVWAMTTSGSMSSYNVGSWLYSSPTSIISGPDGNLWFTEPGDSVVAKMTTSGVVTKYTLMAGVTPTSLTAGPDGAIWFSAGAGKIGRITTSGVVALYGVPGPAHDGLCDYKASPLTLYGCIVYTPVSGVNNVALPITPAPRNTLSGALTDQNGSAVVGATITLTDAYSNSVSGTTGSGGSYSVAVEPGMYRLSVALSTSGVADGLYPFTMSQSGAPSINLTAGNVTQNLVLPVATINYADINRGGNTIFTGIIPGTVLLYAGDPGETLSGTYRTSISDSSSSDTVGSFNSIIGVVYASGSICHNTTCLTASLTISAGPYYVSVNNLRSPTNLQTTSPTTLPSLSWTAAPAVSLYTIYRDGSAIGMTTGTTFIDNNVSSGTHSYYVMDADSVGHTNQSSTINVTVNATVPALGTPSLSVNPVVAGQTTTVTVQVTGNRYGIAGGEYFIGADPGQGNGVAMTYANGTLTAVITGSTLGNQTVNIRAHNGTGWSSLATATLTVLPTAPTGLTAESPTTEPILSWTAVSGVTSYKVYRDGALIGTVADVTYTDVTATEGTYSYYVTAVDDAGDASSPSNTVSVEVLGVDQAVTYYTVNDGTSFSKQTTPPTTGVSTQVDNPDGSVTVGVNSAPGYADSGFTTWTGTLGSLPNFTVTGTGDQFSLNLWFDTSGDGTFFQWDSNGAMTGLGGDTYSIGPTSTDGTLTVTGDTSFFMMDDGLSYTLAQLIAGDDPTSGINANTVVTIWMGVSVNSGSASATISSIGALE